MAGLRHARSAANLRPLRAGEGRRPMCKSDREQDVPDPRKAIALFRAWWTPGRCKIVLPPYCRRPSRVAIWGRRPVIAQRVRQGGPRSRPNGSATSSSCCVARSFRGTPPVDPVRLDRAHEVAVPSSMREYDVESSPRRVASPSRSGMVRMNLPRRPRDRRNRWPGRLPALQHDARLATSADRNPTT